MEKGALIEMNGIVVSEMRPDGYVNATRMCQSAGKRLHHWLRLEGTQSLLKSMERSARIRADLLVQQVTEGPNEQRGTWVHPHVAVQLASWCNSDFAAAVSDVVFRYTTGQMTTEESQAVAARLGVMRILTPPDVRMTQYASAMSKITELTGFDFTNPRIVQKVRDSINNIYLEDATAKEPVEKWRGVVEIAEQLGYGRANDESTRIALGKHVSKAHTWTTADRRKEERIVNGRMATPWIYRVTPELKQIIKDFFESV